jgi:uncharacterized membrane protein
MDIWIVLFRLIHIPSAVVWVAGNMMMTLWVGPTAAAVGKDAAPFMQHLSMRSKFSTHVAIASVLTVLSGIILYWLLFQGINVTSTAGLMLTIGGLLGIGGLGHGIFVLKANNDRMMALVNSFTGPPTSEQAAQLASLQEKSARHGAILTIIVVAALIFMTLGERLAF